MIKIIIVIILCILSYFYVKYSSKDYYFTIAHFDNIYNLVELNYIYYDELNIIRKDKLIVLKEDSYELLEILEEIFRSKITIKKRK
ncbi:MAG: hypothetical protein RSB77_01035 [Bacilli bacterium]